MKILVTGGAGFIGAHCTLELLTLGYDVFVLDNLSNSSVTVLDRIKTIIGRKPEFLKGDICDRNFIRTLFKNHQFDAVFHFAGKKSVNESILFPLHYYDTNVSGTINLLLNAVDTKVDKFIFSSSATVYDENAASPVSESAPVCGMTPYGRSKIIIENVLKDVCIARPNFAVAALRYFNPAGAHPSGLLGEDPGSTATNLVPVVTEALLGDREQVAVYGSDFETADGSGIRDYIHVMDLVRGHIAALDALKKYHGFNVWNLGTGKGYSVHSVIDKFQEVANCKIQRQVKPRRPGDRAISFADPTKANTELGWIAENCMDDIIEDTIRWSRNLRMKKD